MKRHPLLESFYGFDEDLASSNEVTDRESEDWGNHLGLMGVTRRKERDLGKYLSSRSAGRGSSAAQIPFCFGFVAAAESFRAWNYEASRTVAEEAEPRKRITAANLEP
jgi:hypothetical protein